MRSYTGTFLGHLAFITVCCIAGPIFLALGIGAWPDGADRGFAVTALGVGVIGTASIPFSTLKIMRADFPRIARRDRLRERSGVHADDTLVLYTPTAAKGSAKAQMTRADVLEAEFVRYHPEGEATFTTYAGNYDPAEVKPVIRLKLRVRGTEPADGFATLGEFETTDEWRLPSTCLSAITAGRLAVLVDPDNPGKVEHVNWPRSLQLAGTRTLRVIDLDGRRHDMTRRPGLLMEHMRRAHAAGDAPRLGSHQPPRGRHPGDTDRTRRPGDPAGRQARPHLVTDEPVGGARRLELIRHP